MFYWQFHFDSETPIIAHLLNENEHIYWILNSEGEVHSIWGLWVSGLQKCKSNEFFRNRAGGQQFSVGSKKSLFSERAAAPARFWHSQKFVGKTLTSPVKVEKQIGRREGCHVHVERRTYAYADDRILDELRKFGLQIWVDSVVCNLLSQHCLQWKIDMRWWNLRRSAVVEPFTLFARRWFRYVT